LRAQPFYEFGPYQLDPQERVLRREGVPVPLAPKAFETLLALVEKSGHVVEKGELMSRVWPDTYVEEQNLAFNISVLRKALGQGTDDGAAYIETVPKRGYRFTSEVRQTSAEPIPRTAALVSETRSVTRVVTEEEIEVDDEALAVRQADMSGKPEIFVPRIDGEHLQLSSGEYAAPWLWRHRRSMVVAAVLLVAVVLVAGVLVMVRYWKASPAVANRSFKAAPFTTSPGFEGDPALSPDGNQIAYAWKREDVGNYDIYIQLVDSSTPLQLTNNPKDDSDPIWSPDGRRIAFYRSPDIYVISALGGPERKLGSANNGAMSWSADGKALAIVDRPANTTGTGNGIFLLSIDTGERRQLTTPPAGGGDGTPVFSPDGQIVAFNRSVNSGNVNEIYRVPASGGEPQPITHDNRIILGFAWASNDELVFSSDRDGARALWRISSQGGLPVKMEGGGWSPTWPTISTRGHHLAFIESFIDANIWRIPLTGSASQNKTPVKLISSTRYDSSAQYSPDGKRIAFRSDRSGSNEIWLCDSEGGSPFQLTHVGGPLAGSPRWSPDGQYIAFDSRHEGQSHIYVISVEGGPVRRLTEQPEIQVVPRWSADGQSIYFFSNSDSHIWKAPAEGGSATHVPVYKGTGPQESTDGKFLYFRREQERPGIYKVPTGGGEEVTVLEMPEPPPWGYWIVVEKGIYFLVRGKPPAIKFLDFATGKVIEISTMERPPLTSDGGLAASPDGQWLLYTQLDNSGSDIMIVNDFR
jgi:Tol biopolymer transport system component/DNA-binding winged helix-turn-helix (wHTH) protein